MVAKTAAMFAIALIFTVIGAGAKAGPETPGPNCNPAPCAVGTVADMD